MKEVIQFLQDLSAHNDKIWFEANKQRYLDAKARIEQFAVELISAIRIFDASIGPLSPKDCTWRIYRDVRFSKDKRPYKTQMGVYVAPGGKPVIFNALVATLNPGDASVTYEGRHIELTKNELRSLQVLLERKEDIITLPLRYVSSYSARRYVRVLNEDGDPEERDVKLGIQSNNVVEIVSGLEAGEVIVI